MLGPLARGHGALVLQLHFSGSWDHGTVASRHLQLHTTVRVTSAQCPCLAFPQNPHKSILFFRLSLCKREKNLKMESAHIRLLKIKTSCLQPFN